MIWYSTQIPLFRVVVYAALAASDWLDGVCRFQQSPRHVPRSKAETGVGAIGEAAEDITHGKR